VWQNAIERSVCFFQIGGRLEILRAGGRGASAGYEEVGQGLQKWDGYGLKAFALFQMRRFLTPYGAAVELQPIK